MVVTRERARYLSICAAVVIGGIVLSGPVAVAIVTIAAPQPAWQSAAVFVERYSPLQTLPYVFGFFIAGGFIAFMAGLAGTGTPEQRPLELAALAFAGVAASLIFFNYVLQTAFVPQSLDAGEAILSMATMANPRSLGWSLEMYGYGILGVATAFAAPLFSRRGRQGAIRLFMIANCVVSVAGAVLVPIIPGWVLTLPGMIAGAAWNGLVAAAMVVVLLELRFGRGTRGGRAA